MERLTSDNPKNNIGNALNLFYIKDGWTWVRGGGPAPDYADISLTDFVRMLVRSNIPDDPELPADDDDLSAMMAEWLMDEPDTAEGIIALIYTAGWAFAELRHRLAYYEDLEEQGRLVVLPCKVGDTVYFRTYAKNATVDLGIQPHEVVATKAYIVTKGEFTDVGHPLWHFGKTVFLSREEAEAALRGGKADG